MEKRMIDFVPKLLEMHPELTHREIRKIIRRGCSMIALNVMKKENINVESSRRKVKFLVYNYGKKREKSSTKPG